MPTHRTFQGGKCCIARVNREQIADGGDVRLQFPHVSHPLLNLGNDLRLTIKLVNLNITAHAASRVPAPGPPEA